MSRPVVPARSGLAVATFAIALALALAPTSGSTAAGATWQHAVVATPITEPATPPPTAPAPTVAPEPLPTVAPVDPDGADDADDGGIDWWPIIVATVLAVVLVVVVGALVGTRRRTDAPRGAATTTRQPNDARSEALHMPTQVQVLTTAQWIHDQLTLELLASAPSAASARWLVERGRIDDAAVGAEQHYLTGDGDNWERLSHTLSALAAAIDTHLQVRNQAPADPQLVEQTAAVVHRDRSVLQQLITVLWPTALG